MGRWKYDEHGWLQDLERQESIENVDEALRFHESDCDAYEKRIAELEADKQIKVSVLVDNEAPFFGAFWSEERDGCFGIVLNLKNCAALGESEEQFNQVVQNTLAHELLHAIQASYGRMFSETQVREALEDPATLECAEDSEQMIQQLMNDLLDTNNRIAELESVGVNLQQQAAEHYQARLAAETELARVKAESLRVVADVEAITYLKCETPTMLLDDELVAHDGNGHCVYLLNAEDITTISAKRKVQPVRLERWEASE